ncbi:unannotated protein [freshwater metagenome]|uniref:Unannotated protein n=1 Tax=freshwater metagenome TaxID=449393 RepID=A0A6J7P6A4_9ZZZZ
MFDRHNLDVVARAKRTVVVHQVLRHDETRDALGAGRRIGSSRKNEMNDVLGHVVFAERDVNLRAGNAIGAISVRNRFGAHRANIGTSLWFGEVHGAGPFTSDHALQVLLFLLFIAVMHEQINCALREQRCHRERHVRRRNKFLHDNANKPWESATVVHLRERNAAPTRIDILAVGIDEAIGSPHRVGRRLEHRTNRVADSIQRSNDLGNKASVLFKNTFDGVSIER